ncbi:MAG: DNA alkylation repair protein [Bacteroidales bacterium]|nr:DNA alkylation repair protein [Bacteroidales bacterium]
MIEEKVKEIREFCIKNSDQSIVDKYSRYFKEGYDGYGIDKNTYEAQRDLWISDWSTEMTLESYLDLGDKLMLTGKYEEKSFAISFLESEKKNFRVSTFDRIGAWFDMGIDNWATTDVLCMLVLPVFLTESIIDYGKLTEWNTAESEWQRRAVPVTLIELARKSLEPGIALALIEPLMLDESEYVRKGLGTLLRTLWKSYPSEVEEFLLKWKDTCGRIIIQYACEKMDKEYRKLFRKTK